MQDKIDSCCENTSSTSKVIASFFDLLTRGKIPYCVVGSNADQLPKVPDNDIDIIVAVAFLFEVERVIIESAASCNAVISQILPHETCAYYYVLSVACGEGYQFVKLDICSDYLRNGRLMIPADKLLDGRRALWRDNKQFLYLPSPKAEFAYYIMKKVDKGHLDEKALCHLKAVYAEDAQGCDAVLRENWPGEMARQLQDAVLREDMGFFAAKSTELRRTLHAKLPRRSSGLLYLELRRLFVRITVPTGFAVVLLGPDGSGKSTVLSKIVPRTAALGRQTRQFHLWPKSGRQDDQGAPVTDPHALPPRGLASSTLKLLFLVWRYNAGWLAAIFKPYRRSAMIWFDRYYHDMLADPPRYRMGAPAWLVRLFGRLIPKPDLFLILDVRPEVARTRKSEVSEVESQRQFHAYRALAKDLPNAVLIDANGTPEEVASACERAVVESIACRLDRRMGWKRTNRVSP